MKRSQNRSQGKTAIVKLAVRARRTPCEWGRHQQESGQTIFKSGVSLDRTGELFDAWLAREQFLAVRGAQGAYEFLSAIGRFTLVGEEEVWTEEDIVSWQRLIAELMQVAPARWEPLVNKRFPHTLHSGLAAKFTGRFNVQFALSNRGAYIGVIEVETILLAILASVYVDWMANERYGFCAREDCHKSFRITSKHPRLYCGEKCRHHEIVRRSRLKERAGKGTGRRV